MSNMYSYEIISEFFILLILVMALLVFLVTNIVHSLIALIGVFLFSAILLFILGVEFIGALIILVYVGAVSVLFLFVVMMLNVRMIELYYIP